ncbi:MAG: PKD domain-containing protein, partial [Solirubrobacteraceae bacterium]
VRLAAAARDRWSGAALSWALGDGTAPAGAAVEHAFPPGTHTVTLTAADGAGNVTRATRILRVAAAPVPPAPEVVTSTVFTRWAFNGKRFALLSMRVARPPARAEVELRCRGGKCPFRSRTVTRRKRDKGQLAVVKTLSAKRALDLRGRRFRAGQRVQVRITAPGAIGRVVTFKLKAGLEPRGKPACLPPGSRTPEACPQ